MIAYDIPWNRFTDSQFSLKSVFAKYGGFGKRKPKEVREDGTKLVFSSDTPKCRKGNCDNLTFSVAYKGRRVYPVFCDEHRNNKGGFKYADLLVNQKDLYYGD